MTSGKKRAEAATNERGDKEKQMISQPRAYLLLHRGLTRTLPLFKPTHTFSPFVWDLQTRKHTPNP